MDNMGSKATTTPITSPSLNGSRPKEKAASCTPTEWMEFSILMGWPILTMSEGRSPRFMTSDGESITVTPAVRADIVAAVGRGSKS